MTMKKLLGISLAIIMILGSVPLGFSEPLRVQLEQGIETNQIQCNNPNHVLVQRTNGNIACVTENTALKLGWIIIDDSITKIEFETSTPELSLITETQILSDKQLSITNIGKEEQNLLSSSFVLNPTFWPQHTLSFPEQVMVGEPFDVVLDYAFLTPTIDDDEFGVEFEVWEEPESQCDTMYYCATMKIGIHRLSNVDLINRPDYVFESVGNNAPYLPRLSGEGGYVHPTFNNTAPQQETFTFVINQPTNGFNYGDMEVSFPQKGDEKIYMYIDPFGIVHLSDIPIPVQMDSSTSAFSFSMSGNNAVELGMESGIINSFTLEEFGESEIIYPKDLFVRPYGVGTQATTSSDPTFDSLLVLISELKEQFPDRNVEEMIRYFNFSSSLYDEFFDSYPEFKTQSINPLAQYFIIPEAFGQAPPTSFVRGDLKHYDASNSLATLGNIKICAYDVEGDTLTELLNGATHICTNSRDDGSFSLASIPQNDPNGVGSVDLILRAYAESDNFVVYRILESPSTTHIVDSINAKSDILGNSLYTYGDFVLDPTEPSSKVFGTIAILEPIRDWYISNSLTIPPPLSIIHDPYVCVGTGASTTTIHVDDSHRLRTGDEPVLCPLTVTSPLRSQDTLAHEYAHVQFFLTYDSKGSDYPSRLLYTHDNRQIHSPVHTTPAPASWLEGWADFMAIAYTLDDTDPNNDGIYQPFYMRGHWNFETRTNTETQDPLYAGKPFVTGIEGEGNVAAILYDAIDTTNESGDDLSRQLTNIWNTMSDNLETETGETVIATDFVEFYNDWNDSSLPNFDSIFTLNTIPMASACTPEVSNGFVFYDHFTCDLSNWTQSGGGEMWEVKIPDPNEKQRTGFPADNTVANAANCDTDCNLTMTNPISLLSYSSASVEFWRYVDNDVDRDEGLRLEVSTDDTNWIELDRWTKNNREANDIWTKETISLNNYLQNNVKLRFISLASSSFEEVEIDDILIRASTSGGGGGGCAPNCANPNADDDSDGIANSVDTGVNTFSDGTTSGEITDRGGQIFTIVDASGSDGVTISTTSSPTSNALSTTTLCGAKATLTMNRGDSVTATCGSVILDAHGNSFGVVFTDNNGKTFSTRISNGDKVTFDETVPSLSTTSSSNTLNITINGQQYSLNSGSTFTIPSTITGLAGQQSNDSVILNWSASSDGGIPITDYLVQYKKSFDTNWIIFNDGVSSTTGTIVTGLEITSYDFKVAPKNPMGTTDYSNSISIILVNLDISPPEIRLLGDNPQTIIQYALYNELGATCIDDTDGDISSSIVIDDSNVNTGIVGSYQVTYDCQDSAQNNATQQIRTVNVIESQVPPVITLIPPTTQEIKWNDEYDEKGAVCFDEKDGTISNIVIDSSSVDAETLGTYQVTYDCQDSDNNDAVQVIRTVDVVNKGEFIISVYTGNPTENGTFEYTVKNDALGLNYIVEITTENGLGNASLLVDTITSRHIYEISETRSPSGFDINNSNCGYSLSGDEVDLMDRLNLLRPYVNGNGIGDVICKFSHTYNNAYTPPQIPPLNSMVLSGSLTESMIWNEPTTIEVIVSTYNSPNPTTYNFELRNNDANTVEIKSITTQTIESIMTDTLNLHIKPYTHYTLSQITPTGISLYAGWCTINGVESSEKSGVFTFTSTNGDAIVCNYVNSYTP